MKLGIYTWFGYVQPLRDTLHMVRDAGFDRVMLWWGDSLAAYYGTQEETARWVREAGLEVDAIHVPYDGVCRLWDADPIVRDGAFGELLGFAEDCARFGFPRLVAHVASHLEMPPLRTDSLEGFRRLARRTEELGVQAALENTAHNAFLRLVLDDPACDALRFCLDTSHAALRDGWEGLLRDYGSRLVCTHVSDNRGVEDDHFLPGRGSIDWQAVCVGLRDSGLRECLSLEVLADPVQMETLTAPQFLAEAYAAADGLRQMITEETK